MPSEMERAQPAYRLVRMPASTSHRQLDPAGLHAVGISEGAIRVSAGLEHPDDLWADFRQASPPKMSSATHSG
jgi:O-acetylhomoserine/O-acetylserine sulfhydrylase-like pyridoxal-dependent enzyme